MLHFRFGATLLRNFYALLRTARKGPGTVKTAILCKFEA
jgi:hypothetical protein